MGPSTKDLFTFKFRPLPNVGAEGFLMRLLFAALVNWMIPARFNFDSQDAPTGIAHFIDLTFLSDPRALMWVRVTLALLSVPYIFSLGLSVVLPLMTLLHVLVFTYHNSQGYTHHGNQIISLILLAQCCVVLFFTVHRWIKHRPFPMRNGRTRDSYLLYYSQVIIAGVYVTSVVSKMRRSDFQWVQNLPNIAVQLIKTHRQDFYSKPNTSQLTRDADVPMAKWMIANPNHTRFFLGAGLLLEAFAFLCLANRGWAFLIGAMLVSMHWIIEKVFLLSFDLNAWAALIFLINIPFWIIWLGRRRQLRSHPEPTGPGAGI